MKLAEKENKMVFPGYLMPTVNQKFYHVYIMLEEFWGSDEFIPYINKLTVPENSLDYFDKISLMEIIAVQQLHVKEFSPPTETDVWSHTFAR